MTPFDWDSSCSRETHTVATLFIFSGHLVRLHTPLYGALLGSAVFGASVGIVSMRELVDDGKDELLLVQQAAKKLLTMSHV